MVRCVEEVQRVGRPFVALLELLNVGSVLTGIVSLHNNTSAQLKEEIPDSMKMTYRRLIVADGLKSGKKREACQMTV